MAPYLAVAALALLSSIVAGRRALQQNIPSPLPLHDICKGCGDEDLTSCNYYSSYNSGWICRDEWLGLDVVIRTVAAGGSQAGDGVDTVL